MSNQILTILKNRLEEAVSTAGISGETQQNILKEELQYYVLNFIYHHPTYSKWIMYGGSALRIIHGLNRMSVDLDFEVEENVTENFLTELKNEIERYFRSTYGATENFLVIKVVTNRGLLLKFAIGEELKLDQSSKQIHVKIDLNNFVAKKTVTERRPITRNQFSFVILTYNMSALMASKIAAIFLRGKRDVGGQIYEEKGRDIYDLLWYMNKRIVPDFDYLSAKDINVKDIRTLFDRLTFQMNKVSDENLKQDLFPLFVDTIYIKHWLQNWRDSYFQFLADYKIQTITNFEGVSVSQDFYTDNFFFVFKYSTEELKNVRVEYTLSAYWIDFKEGELPTKALKELDELIDFGNILRNSPDIKEKLRKYATLLYIKTENYFRKVNNIILGDKISTKVIRMTAKDLDLKEQIVLNKSALLSCELDDLLR